MYGLNEYGPLHLQNVSITTLPTFQLFRRFLICIQTRW